MRLIESPYDFMNSLGEWAEYFANRPKVAKKDGALRFGILGAANIALTALIQPARSHPEVIVAAVAARDKKKAQAYAKKYNIPIVHNSYDDLINDPAIDAIYNPLPNGLHYEWTLKALKAGKHVLVEKPATSNGEEARDLFRHSVLSSSNAPVILEARHYQFHPAWHTFLSLFETSDVESADATTALPGALFSPEDIRFKYHLAGGTLMDLGTYNLSALRGIFAADPVSVTSARPTLMAPPYDQKCEKAMKASYAFPNNATATLSCDLDARVSKSSGTWWSWLFDAWPNFTANGMPPVCSVVLREKHGVEDDLNITTQKIITMNNFMGPHIWHRIDIETKTTYRNKDDTVVRTERSVESKKAYVWEEGKGKGEDWWPTYRYMLEAFVDRVKGREGSGVWLDGEESIRQMESIDKTYEKAGMLIRPTSKSLSSKGRA